MTLDSAVLRCPTESLILPTKRRFFPLRVPNYHRQLRHYISTADPDRIYVAVDRVIYSIHVSSQKREPIANIPFQPKCLAAGFGWISVGGENNGECAIIKLPDQSEHALHDRQTAWHSDVDNVLPIDLDPRGSSPSVHVEEHAFDNRLGRGQSTKLQTHRFGGSIVNSVNIHRLHGGDQGFADEDVLVLSNNDKTVTIYSLTRAKVLKIIHHRACMNYAIISPNSAILAAVGDEHCAYFYAIARDTEHIALTENGEKATGWIFRPLRYVHMDVQTSFDEGYCFTVAFSPNSQLCAIGSQSGIIAIFDVCTICKTSSEPDDRDTIICYFHSSRPSSGAGAVRSMSFSPDPWDLLVWAEDHGRAGVADVRQAFIRRQLLDLDIKESGLQEVLTDLIPSSFMPFELQSRTYFELFRRRDTPQQEALEPIDGPVNSRYMSDDHWPLDEEARQEPPERERLVAEFLRTARQAHRSEGDLSERPVRTSLRTEDLASPRLHGATNGSSQVSRPASPVRYGYSALGRYRDSHFLRSLSARRQSPAMLPQIDASGSRAMETENPGVGWSPNTATSRTNPSLELQPTMSGSASGESERTTRNLGDSASGDDIVAISYEATRRQSDNLGPSSGPSSTIDDLEAQRRTQRSGSIPRRSERSDAIPGDRYDQSRPLDSELGTNMVAEHMRRHRPHLNTEAHIRISSWEQQYRQQSVAEERPRPARWIRHSLNSGAGGDFIAGGHSEEPSGTAGIGWGADAKTLYIATVVGIFEYQVNVRDRKTFPVLSYR